jgi:hypothetical protein
MDKINRTVEQPSWCWRHNSCHQGVEAEKKQLPLGFHREKKNAKNI